MERKNVNGPISISKKRFVVIYKGGFKRFQGFNAWILTDDKYNVLATGGSDTLTSPDPKKTANRECLKAILSALAYIPNGAEVVFVSDNKNSFGTIKKNTTSNIDLATPIREKIGKLMYRTMYHNFYEPQPDKWKVLVCPFLAVFNSVSQQFGMVIKS